MRRLLSSTLVAVAAFGIAATGAIAGDDELTFKAFLSGSKEVPGVATETSAEFKMTINEDLSEAEFRLEVDDGVKVTALLICTAEYRVSRALSLLSFTTVPPWMWTANWLRAR